MDLHELLVVTLGAVRIAALFLSFHLFGKTVFPLTLKLFFAVGLSATLLPFQPMISAEIWGNDALMLTLILKEIGIGLFLGFGIKSLFWAVSMGLELAGQQIETHQSRVLAHSLSQLGIILSVLFFFAANLHHDLFRILVRSYQAIPLSFAEWDVVLMKERLIYFIRTSFELALRISLPVFLVILIVHLVLSVTTRANPQMNPFFNSVLTINVVAGLSIVLISPQWR